ncbi:3D domain-containing protein [Clostridium paraputrificum]|uniref:3D domain-containing protein n=1 Tax=Clostridium TaxID=1485 RepID=UPI003D340756
MVEKFKEQFKKSFSKGPKAKIMLGLIVGAFVLTMTVVTMRKTVNISIDGKDEVFVTYKGTVKDVLLAKGVEIDPKDKVQPSLEAKVSEKEEIIVKTAVPVKVVIAGQEQEIKTAEDTVGEMLLAEAEVLEEQGINYKEEDIVSPDKNTPINKDMDIKVVQVEVETLTETEVMPYNTVETKDPTKDVSSAPLVKQEGINGEKEVTYEVIKHDGEIVAKNIVSQKAIKAAQDKLVVKGSGAVIVSRGENIVGKKKLYVQATAYSGHGITATGRKPVYNPNGISTIAVDPRVIPLGSKVYVKGYGYAIAADTGGAIKGNIIDVYLNSKSACTAWGRKNGVEVVIVAYPGEW